MGMVQSVVQRGFRANDNRRSVQRGWRLLWGSCQRLAAISSSGNPSFRLQLVAQVVPYVSSCQPEAILSPKERLAMCRDRFSGHS